MAPFGAFALNLGPVAASYDGVFYATVYPAGDKPVAGCSPPSGWTEADKQDGGGEVCEQSATEFDFNVTGTGPRAKFHYVYKDGGAGDVQIKWRTVGSYTGNLTANTAFGGGITDGTADADFWHEAASAYSGSPAVRFTSGHSSADIVITDGDPAQTLPRYFCVAWDKSALVTKGFASADGSAWTEVSSVSHDYPDAKVFLFGSSGSTTSTAQATLDNINVSTTINCYTPEDPPGGSPPVVSDVPNQSVTQGDPHSLTFSGYFTGATSYSVTGIPSGSALSESSDGVFSGTPDADDLAATPFTIQFCGTNVDGTTCDGSQYNVSAASGDVFTIAADTGARDYTCSNASTGANGSSWASIRTSGSSSVPGPGDTIQFAKGNHGRFTFTNCQGSSSSYLTISNKTSDNAQAVIRNTASANNTFLCTDCKYVDFTGLGKWSGAPAGTLGITVSGGARTRGTTQCGISFITTGINPTAWVRFNGLSSDYKIRGLCIDGSAATSGGSGIGIAINDASITWNDYYTSGNYTGIWKENLLFANNYIHDTGIHATGVGPGECMYLGSNGYDQGLPIRNGTVEYNITENCGRAGIQTKYWLSGTNYIRFNDVNGTGISEPSDSGHDSGINIIDGGNTEAYGNRVFNAGGTAITCNNQYATTGTNGANDPTPPGFQGPYYCKIYNNILAHPGALDAAGTPHPDKCVNALRSTDQTPHSGTRADLAPVVYYNNTMVDCSGAQIGSVNTNSATNRIIRNSICASLTSGSCASAGGGSSTVVNNRNDTTANHKFVNSATDDYHLTSTSPACNQGTSADGLTTDFEGESRPQDSANDQGADEATACP